LPPLKAGPPWWIAVSNFLNAWWFIAPI